MPCPLHSWLWGICAGCCCGAVRSESMRAIAFAGEKEVFHSSSLAFHTEQWVAITSPHHIHSIPTANNTAWDLNQIGWQEPPGGGPGGPRAAIANDVPPFLQRSYTLHVPPTPHLHAHHRFPPSPHMTTAPFAMTSLLEVAAVVKVEDWLWCMTTVTLTLTLQFRSPVTIHRGTGAVDKSSSNQHIPTPILTTTGCPFHG